HETPAPWALTWGAGSFWRRRPSELRDFAEDLAHLGRRKGPQRLRRHIVQGAQGQHRCGRRLVVGGVEDHHPVVGAQAPVLLLDLDAQLLGASLEVGRPLAGVPGLVDALLGELDEGHIRRHRRSLLSRGVKRTPDEWVVAGKLYPGAGRTAPAC